MDPLVGRSYRTGSRENELLLACLAFTRKRISYRWYRRLFGIVQATHSAV
jgi:hypothetical protein